MLSNSSVIKYYTFINYSILSILHAEWVRAFRAFRQGRKHGTKCGGRPVQGVWGTEVPSRGEAPVGGLGDEVRSPPEAEAILDFYMHNFDLILNYFCFARATSGWLMLRNGSCLSMK